MANAPELNVDEYLYWLAFIDLQPDSAGTGWVPWSVIDRWCEYHEVHGDLRETVFVVLRKMCLAQIDYQRSKQTSQQHSSKASGGAFRPSQHR